MEKMTETQVAVIGGGISGTAIARELTKYKIDVCLLDKETSPGFGITKGSQGMLHGGGAYLNSRIIKFQGGEDLKQYLQEPFNLKERWGNLGREEYFALAPILDVEIAKPGKITLAESTEDLQMIDFIKEIANEQGIGGLEMLDRKALEEMEPYIHPKFIGGLFDANEAVITPTAWAIAFSENAKNNGGHMFMQTEVKEIKEEKDYYLIKTNRGSFKAEYVVNAAGLYADKIAKMVGVADFEVSGWKVQLIVMENRDYIRHVLVLVPRPQVGRIFIPTTHNSILLAHTFEPMTYKEDRSTSKDKLDELLSWPEEMVPSISKNHVISNFASFLTFNTKNPHDHLLECPKRGFINAVVGAPGLAQAPAMAHDVVRILGDQGLELTTRSDFNPYRLKEPRFIDLPREKKNDLIRSTPAYGRMVCRCMHVSEQEIRAAVRAGATTLDEIKWRTLAGMGRCQGGFCTSRALQIMAEEMHVSPLEITKKGGNSHILKGKTKSFRENRLEEDAV